MSDDGVKVRWIGVAALGLAFGTSGHAAESTTAAVSFRRDLAPVLVERCVRCHGEDAAKGGYRADSYARLNVPGKSGRNPVVKGQPESSVLYSLLVTDDSDDRMPQKGEPLDTATIDRFKRWIRDGAVFDGADPNQPLAELRDGRELPTAPTAYAFPVPVAAVVVLPGDRIATGGYREVNVWSMAGALERRLGPTPERTQAMSLHPDGRRLFVAGGVPGRSGTACVLDLTGNGPAHVFHRGTDTLLALVLSPDGSRVAVAGTERSIVLYDTVSLLRVQTLTGHSDWVQDLAFSPDGRWLATASRDRTARVFDVADGSLVSAFRDHNAAVTAVAFVDGTNRVVTAGRDGRVRTWNPGTGKAVRSSPQISAEPTRLLVSGDRLVSGWTDGRLREWRPDDMTPAREFECGGKAVLGIARHHGVVVASDLAGSIFVWNDASGEAAGSFTAKPQAGTSARAQ